MVVMMQSAYVCTYVPFIIHVNICSAHAGRKVSMYGYTTIYSHATSCPDKMVVNTLRLQPEFLTTKRKDVYLVLLTTNGKDVIISHADHQGKNVVIGVVDNYQGCNTAITEQLTSLKFMRESFSRQVEIAKMVKKQLL